MGKEMPLGVKVISVLYYVGCAVSVVIGLMLIIGSSAVDTLAQQNPALATFSSGFAIVGGFVFLAVAVLGFFIGRGLWKGQSWSRITTIILSAIGVLFAIVAIVGGDFTSIISLAINSIIGSYLLFSSDVKAAFD